MNFIIRRTSSYTKKPCREAYKDTMRTGYGEREIYRINVNSLEQLIKLVEKYGDIIIGPHYMNKNEMNIEIYDDYRE